jgi:hypothetical protein
VPLTVKNMARASGIVVLTSDDLATLFLSTVPQLPLPLTAAWVATEIRRSCRDIQKAK